MRTTMKRLIALPLILFLTSCAATAEERVGESAGYGGPLKVTVSMDGDRIAAVTVTEHHETEGVGTRAIASMPEAMVQAGKAEVDIVSGATVTSQALIAAVQNALGQESASPSAGPDASDAPQTGGALPEGARSGVGMSATGRVGPGTDDQGNQVYSFNVVFAHGVFDGEGRVLTMDVDQLEVATPNYDGATMPHFSGFPGQGGYALWDDDQGKVSGKTEDTDETFMAEVSGWMTKRARGEDYKLSSGTWAEQMDAYQRLFVGKTVDEIEDWFGRYCSDSTGRPLKDGSDKEDDQAKWDALSAEEQAMLADVTSSATISLRDSHGDILAALRAAWEDAQQRP